MAPRRYAHRPLDATAASPDAWAVTPESAIAEAQAGKLRPVYLVLGEERLLVDRVVSALREATLTRAFPEMAADPRPSAVWLAEHALTLGTPFHLAFALEAMFRELPADGDGPEYALMMVVAFGAAYWVGANTDGSALPMIVGVAFCSAAVAFIAWVPVQRVRLGAV